MTRLRRIAEAGADVARIRAARVLVKIDDRIGCSFDAHPLGLLCRHLDAIGFGEVLVCGAMDYVDGLSECCTRGHVRQAPGIWLADACAEQTPEFRLAIDLSNDARSKALSARLCCQRGAPWVSVGWGPTWMSLASFRRAPAAGFDPSPLGDDGQPPLSPVRAVAAGAALQEAVMSIGGFDGWRPTNGPVVYDISNEARTSIKPNSDWVDPVIAGAEIDVVGAGGIGASFVAAFLPLLREGRLNLYDPDSVQEVNLPGQPIYDDGDVGDPKVHALRRKLGGVCPEGVAICPFVSRYEERPQPLSRPCLRVVCADNFAARETANGASLADGVPLLDAGSSVLAAQQRSYYPGLSSCLAHRIPELRTKASAERMPNSCSRNPAATLPGVNLVIAGVLAAEAARALRPGELGPPSGGMIVYDARFARRFDVVDVLPPCTHAAETVTVNP